MIEILNSIKLRLIPTLSLVLLLGGCASIDAPGYREQTPEFTLEKFFDGQVKAWGMVQNRRGDVVQRFVVDIAGAVDGNVLTLDESFEYSLGEGVASRVWVIEKVADGSYQGTADDVLPGALGRSWGNAFNWTYQMELPVGGRSYKVRFNDWIWAFDENTIMNRAYIKKFGLTFAEVTLFMQKQ